MGEMRIISESGQFDGLRENKEDCINIRMSELNNNNKFRILSSSKAKVIRLLIDIKPTNEREFMRYLNELSANNPNIEFHINIEFDKYFEYAKKIMSNVTFRTKSITLWPDGDLKDRSYLDLTNLNCKTIIPLQYVMWHNNIERANASNLYFLRKDVETKDGTLPFDLNFTYKENGLVNSFDSNLYTLKDAIFLKSTAYKILITELKDLINCSLAPDQKILVLMKYFVDNFTYTDTPKSANGKMTFLNTDFSYKAAYTLINKQGVCEGIAEAFMILLNNPIMQIDCRCLAGLAYNNDLNSDHAWNVVKLIDEKSHVARWFYMDSTWNINDRNYYNWSFLKANAMSQRKIYDCANPVYESYDNIELNENVMSYRLDDALDRIDKKKNGIHQIRFLYSLEDIINNARRNGFRH